MPDTELTITASPNMVNFNEYLDYLIRERNTEWEKKVLTTNSEYQLLRAKLDDCYKTLREMLAESEPRPSHY